MPIPHQGAVTACTLELGDAGHGEPLPDLSFTRALSKMNITFFGSMCTSDLWVPVSVSTIGFADSTDVTLADEDTNSILTDDANRTLSQASDQI